MRAAKMTAACRVWHKDSPSQKCVSARHSRHSRITIDRSSVDDRER